MIGLDFRYDNSFIQKTELEHMEKEIERIHNLLQNKECEGNEYLGWLEYPMRHYSKQIDLDRIISISKEIKSKSEILIVIGIGGSYIGGKAAHELLNHSFFNNLSREERKVPQIFFAGQNLSSSYHSNLIDVMKDKDFSICVISKSGTTIEPAISFRIFKKLLEDKYGKEEAKTRIITITDANKGALRELSIKEGYRTFEISDDIGGRYSVLTPVGLFPMAIAGIDIENVLSGANCGCMEYNNPKLDQNKCYQYAALRNILNKQGKDIEVLSYFEPAFSALGEWWKQLFGESEGKNGMGVFPVTLQYTTDLHSMGQYMQQGKRNMFETIIKVTRPNIEIVIDEEEDNLDGFNYLSGKTLDYINQRALEGTLTAHRDGNVPILEIEIPKINEFYFGQLVYFFEKACAISSIMLGVNGFIQPGVEKYKSNMYQLLKNDWGVKFDQT